MKKTKIATTILKDDAFTVLSSSSDGEKIEEHSIIYYFLRIFHVYLFNIESKSIGDDETISQTLTQFQHMSNEFETAVWLANHSRILNLALEIKNAKSIPITNEEKSQGSQGSKGLQGHNFQVEITQIM